MIEFDYQIGEATVRVIGEYIPGSRGARDSLGGRPGMGPPIEPDEPPDFEVESITYKGREVRLREDYLEEIVEKGVEESENSYYDWVD